MDQGKAVVRNLQRTFIPHVNALVYTAVRLENKKTSILKKLIPQRYSGKVPFFNSFSEEWVVKYYLTITMSNTILKLT